MQLHEIEALVGSQWSHLHNQQLSLSAFGQTGEEILQWIVRAGEEHGPAVEAAMLAIAEGGPLPLLTPAEALLSALRLQWAGGALKTLHAWEQRAHPTPLEHDRCEVLCWLLLERWEDEGFDSIAASLEALDLPPPPPPAVDDRN